MTAMTLDTLKYSKTLIESGIPAKQAEGQATALAAAIEDQVPTKHDFNTLEVKMDRLENKFDALENKILTKLGGLILVCTAILGFLTNIHH